MSGLSEDMRDAIVHAALDLCSATPWAQVRVHDIASSAGVDLDVIYEMGGKPAILAHIDRFFDKAMGRGVAALSVDASEADMREQLCDVMMQRFDALERHRPAVMHIHAYLKTHPSQLALAAARRLETARWAIAVSGLDETAMELKTLGLAAGFARAMRVWVRDVAPNELTLAAIDRDLRRYNDWIRDAGRIGDWVKTAFSGAGGSAGKARDSWRGEEAGETKHSTTTTKATGQSPSASGEPDDGDDASLAPPPPPL